MKTIFKLYTDRGNCQAKRNMWKKRHKVSFYENYTAKETLWLQNNVCKWDKSCKYIAKAEKTAEKKETIDLKFPQ
ncbi:MAG: hypothetical protein J6J83_03185 [Oscillospiraceae bacterium]|nr:hypothetical protein [Oscillospiraceae bacterium]